MSTENNQKTELIPLDNVDGDIEENNGKDIMSKIEYDPQDDAMHVDFNEEQWLPCIPGLSLTMATIIFAIIGAGVGITIALVNGDDIGEKTVTMYMNITDEPYNSSKIYGGYIIRGISEINGTAYFDYTMSYDKIIKYNMTETISDEWAKIIAFPGKLWVNALKLLVLPLIILMMVVLPSRVDEIGFIGKRAVPLYLFTSTCAAIQGTCWAWIIQPGKVGETPDVMDRDLEDNDVTELDSFLNIFSNAVPSNIVSAMAGLQILGVIVFFLGIGILLRAKTVKPVERDTVLNFSKAILRCCMMAVVWIVWFTPIGMASLVCVKIATTENLADLLAALGFYLLTVIIGHGVHVFGFYPLTFFATTRGNGWRWFTKIYKAPLMAFATSSSAATLPRSLQVAHEAKVRKEIYQFILPLGSAINMDGTALGFPIMIALIAQLHDISLDVGSVITVMLLSVVISVGTAPIPNAGMVYLTMLFTAAGMPELAGEGIATLFVLDWLVDRIETAVNVTSDQYVAKIIDEVSLNAKEKGVKVVLGCCLGPNSGYQMAQTQIDNNATV